MDVFVVSQRRALAGRPYWNEAADARVLQATGVLAEAIDVDAVVLPKGSGDRGIDPAEVGVSCHLC